LTFARANSRELLDELTPSDPRAMRSRRDLLRVNRIMGARGILARAMQPIILGCSKHRAVRVLELGAGDGRLMLSIARQVAGSWPAIDLTFLDRQALIDATTRAAFAHLGWSTRTQVMDVLEWVEWPAKLGASIRWDLIVTNLFLHHFDQSQLRALLSAIAERCNALVACEPRRALLPLFGSHLMGAIGASRLTRHDAVLSVRAGFRDRELTSIWPDDRGDWQQLEGRAGPFSHLFRATRIGIATSRVA
jgi:2-polyprenyl-3-methyl-5-hydroxy-6-metoxy-1,4-benzoquinol methylase